MRNRLVALATAGLLLALATAPATAVTGNYTNDFDHPFVGLAVFYDAQGEFSHRCSGSLVSPTVVVTAGHCTEGVTEARIYFEQDAGAHYDSATGIDPVSGYPEWGGVTGTAHNYGFSGFAGYPNTRDLGVVVLDEPIGASKYQITEFGQLPTAGFLDSVAKRGTDYAWFTMSGYGLSDQKPVTVSYRIRLKGTSQLVNLGSRNTDGYNLQTTASKGEGRAGTCSGDSGGPFFWRDTNIIVSVNSFGMSAICAGVDFSYRIDRSATLDWIAGFLD
ncbi:MAG: S1 family peptidase [Chloroflexi bacterium]|jgi:secreted trypsin-like serine protease|nr:S1 family peptidase [Chloroflexota bacterium]